MSALYVTCLMVLDASTGETLQEFCTQTPISLEQCSRENTEKGPINTVEGKAVVLYCRKAPSTET